MRHHQAFQVHDGQPDRPGWGSGGIPHRIDAGMVTAKACSGAEFGAAAHVPRVRVLALHEPGRAEDE